MFVCLSICVDDLHYKQLRGKPEAYTEFFIEWGQIGDQQGQPGTQNAGDLYLVISH